MWKIKLRFIKHVTMVEDCQLKPHIREKPQKSLPQKETDFHRKFSKVGRFSSPHIPKHHHRAHTIH